MNKQISIIGCGWLGLPLAKHFISEGYTIKGSTTSVARLKLLQNANVNGFIVHLHESGIEGNLLECLEGSETLIINIPPGIRNNPNKNHIAEITHLIEGIEKSFVKNVLYISSSSVYMDEENFPVIEATTKPNSNSKTGKQLIKIEKILQDNPNFKTSILRFGGLFDKKRHPAIYLSGKKNIANPNAPINLIHKKDCIAIISKIINSRLWSINLNAVYPNHPNKKEYYTNYCIAQNLVPPEFNFEEKSKGKLISSSKLVQLLNYEFKHAP